MGKLHKKSSKEDRGSGKKEKHHHKHRHHKHHHTERHEHQSDDSATAVPEESPAPKPVKRAAGEVISKSPKRARVAETVATIKRPPSQEVSEDESSDHGASKAQARPVRKRQPETASAAIAAPAKRRRTAEKGKLALSRKVEEPSPHDKRIDRLAELLGCFTTCTSVAFIGDRFYISTNDFSEHEGADDQKGRLMNRVMIYLQSVANKAINPEERKNLVRALCWGAIQNKFKGAVSISEETLDRVLDAYGYSTITIMNLGDIAKAIIYEEKQKNNRLDVTTACVLAGEIVAVCENLKKFEEDFVSGAAPEISRVFTEEEETALKNKYQLRIVETGETDLEDGDIEFWKEKSGELFYQEGKQKPIQVDTRTPEVMKSIDKLCTEQQQPHTVDQQLDLLQASCSSAGSGYNILYEQPDKGVHAEMQILEKLIRIFAQAKANAGEEENARLLAALSKGVYIGISKLCCPMCYEYLLAAKNVLAKYDVKIEFRGTHGRKEEDKENWKLPKILFQTSFEEKSEEDQIDISEEEHTDSSDEDYEEDGDKSAVKKTAVVKEDETSEEDAAAAGPAEQPTLSAPELIKAIVGKIKSEAEPKVKTIRDKSTISAPQSSMYLPASPSRTSREEEIRIKLKRSLDLLTDFEGYIDKADIDEARRAVNTLSACCDVPGFVEVLQERSIAGLDNRELFATLLGKIRETEEMSETQLSNIMQKWIAPLIGEQEDRRASKFFGELPEFVSDQSPAAAAVAAPAPAGSKKGDATLFSCGHALIHGCPLRQEQEDRAAEQPVQIAQKPHDEPDEQKAAVEDERSLSRKVSDQSLHNRRIDRLAELLGCSTTCSATAFIGDKFYISTNDFSTGTKANNAKKQLMNRVMLYLQAVATGTIDVEEKKALFRELCLASIDSKFKGAIPVSEATAVRILESCQYSDFTVANLYEVVKKIIYEEPKVENRVDISTACVLAAEMIAIGENLSKLEESINPPRQALAQAPETEIESVFSEQEKSALKKKYEGSDHGYDILLEQHPQKVHAEMQILEKLIKIFVEAKADESREDNARLLKALKEDGVYIGISKLCCPKCYEHLMAAKEVLQEHGIKIDFRGTHGVLVKKWQPPEMFSTTQTGLLGEITEKIKKKAEQRMQKIREKTSAPHSSMYIPASPSLTGYASEIRAKLRENLILLENLKGRISEHSIASARMVVDTLSACCDEPGFVEVLAGEQIAQHEVRDLCIMLFKIVNAKTGHNADQVVDFMQKWVGQLIGKIESEKIAEFLAKNLKSSLTSSPAAATAADDIAEQSPAPAPAPAPTFALTAQYQHSTAARCMHAFRGECPVINGLVSKQPQEEREDMQVDGEQGSPQEFKEEQKSKEELQDSHEQTDSKPGRGPGSGD